MKRDPFEDYSKPTDISDDQRKEHIRNAFKDLIQNPRSHYRIGDITTYLNYTHADIEFDNVSTARLIFEMNKEMVWTCEEIDSVLYPVCYPRCDCKALAVYKKPWLAKS